MKKLILFAVLLPITISITSCGVQSVENEGSRALTQLRNTFVEKIGQSQDQKYDWDRSSSCSTLYLLFQMSEYLTNLKTDTPSRIQQDELSDYVNQFNEIAIVVGETNDFLAGYAELIELTKTPNMTGAIRPKIRSFFADQRCEEILFGESPSVQSPSPTPKSTEIVSGGGNNSFVPERKGRYVEKCELRNPTPNPQNTDMFGNPYAQPFERVCKKVWIAD